MRVQVTIAFLLGVIATLLAVLVFGQHQPPVYAQTTAGGFMMAGTGNAEPGGRNLLWVIDGKTDTPRMALYEWDGGRLKLHASRNIKYDLEFDQYPPKKNSQIPSVQDVYRETEKARRERRQEKKK